NNQVGKRILTRWDKRSYSVFHDRRWTDGRRRLLWQGMVRRRARSVALRRWLLTSGTAASLTSLDGFGHPAESGRFACFLNMWPLRVGVREKFDHACVHARVGVYTLHQRRTWDGLLRADQGHERHRTGCPVRAPAPCL